MCVCGGGGYQIQAKLGEGHLGLKDRGDMSLVGKRAPGSEVGLGSPLGFEGLWPLPPHQSPVLCSAWHCLLGLHQESTTLSSQKRTAEFHPIPQLTLISSEHGLQGPHSTQGPVLGPATDPGMDPARGL